MDIKSELSKSLNLVVRKLVKEDLEVEISIPSDLSKGDFTTNIAMRVSKKLGNPMSGGEKIVEELKKEKELYNFFEKIELVKPGFINFYLSQAQISTKLKQLLEVEKKVDLATKSKKVVFEFGDPNPFKEPHIGHLRNFILGESISRIFEANNTDVARANYQGDVGLHVAKAIYGVIKLGIDIFEKDSVEDKAKFLGKAYAFGAKEYEENVSAKQEIIEINKKIYSKNPEVMKIWEKGRAVSLEYFETLYKILGVKYEKYYFESETSSEGLRIVKENIPKVFVQDNGAIIFRGEEEGLHTRVFITKEGNPMYEAKDLALAFMKENDFPDYDSMIMTANEQSEYFKVLIKALEKISPEISHKTKHLSYGFVNLKEGKMSSRTGNVISAFWLLNETRNRLKEGYKEVDDDVLDMLSVGSVKWAMLRFSRESDISFSIEESIQIEGNSGPYMMYAFARANSILRKSKENSLEAKLESVLKPEILSLGRLLCQFDSVVEEANHKLSPNILSNYLFNVAQSFNTFYEKEKIIGSDDETQRIMITSVVTKVLKEGLYLLGIESPEKI